MRKCCQKLLMATKTKKLNKFMPTTDCFFRSLYHDLLNILSYQRAHINLLNRVIHVWNSENSYNFAETPEKYWLQLFIKRYIVETNASPTAKRKFFGIQKGME